MGYEITIARISNDYKTAEKISKEEWINCSIPNEIEFIEKETYPKHYLEVKSVVTEEFIPCFWISKDFNSAFINSVVFLMNSEFEKYAIEIASKLNAIIFGQEGELYYIPCIGKIESDKKLLEQQTITIMELMESNLNITNKMEVSNYIQTKIKKASS